MPVVRTPLIETVHSLTIRVDNAEHSHPIGEANLMFTKRGRKAIAEKSAAKPVYHNMEATSPSNVDQQQAQSPPPQSTPSLPTPFPQQAPPQQVQVPAPQVYQQPQQQQAQPIQPQQQQPHPQPTFVPPQFALPQQPHQIPMQQVQDRWENMSAIFTSVRETARGAMFDPAAVAALETLLLRMYFEASSGGLMGHHAAMGHMQQQHAGMGQMQHLGQGQGQQMGQQGMGQQNIGQQNMGQQGMGQEQESSSDEDGSEEE